MLVGVGGMQTARSRLTAGSLGGLLACQLQGQRSGWLERGPQGCRARVTAMRLTGGCQRPLLIRRTAGQWPIPASQLPSACPVLRALDPLAPSIRPNSPCLAFCFAFLQRLLSLPNPKQRTPICRRRKEPKAPTDPSFRWAFEFHYTRAESPFHTLFHHSSSVAHQPIEHPPPIYTHLALQDRHGWRSRR